jgi:hypothetical protein
MLPTFQFDNYTLRPAAPGDLELATQWTEADPDHYRKIVPQFWVDGRDAYLLLDPAGPVFFFKIELKRNREAKIYIQFGCDGAGRFRRRTMQGMIAGLAWLRKELMRVGVEDVYFTSKQQALITFCTARLGFKLDGDTLRKSLLEVSDGG